MISGVRPAMEVFDLRAISAVAPMVDLTAGIFAMLVAVLAAHAVFIPKFYFHNPRLALAFLAISLPGLFAVVATLAIYPARIYLASFIYVVVFVFLGCVVPRSSPNKYELRRRAVAGSASMLFSVAFAWWLAFAPR